MADINQSIIDNYSGPICLYKLLEEKNLQNPLFLKRNILSSPRGSQRIVDKQIQISGSLERKISERLYVSLIVNVVDKKQLNVNTFEIVDGKAATLTVNNDWQVSFPLQKLPCFGTKPKAIRSVIILIMHSSSENTDASDLSRAHSLCKRLSSFSFDGYVTEEVSLKLKSLMSMVDLSALVKNYLYVDKKKSQPTPFSPSFYSFFSPIYSCRERKEGFILSNRFQCAVYNQKVFDQEEDIKISLSAYLRSKTDTNATVKIKTEHTVSHPSGGKEAAGDEDGINRKRTRSSTVLAVNPLRNPQEPSSSTQLTPTTPRSQPKSTLHYHLLVRLQKENYVEFHCEQRDSLACIWCGSLCRKPIRYDSTKNQLQRKTALRLFQLVQHLNCCHYHFKSSCFLDLAGQIHIYISRLSSAAVFPVPSKKSFFTLKALKINTHNIHVLHWQQDKPKISLSNIFTDYYHSTTGLKVSIEDMKYESDDEDIDYTTMLKFRNNVIDEYSDITKHEKEFMKLWNMHIASFPGYGDKLVPLLCQRFLIQYGSVIIEKNLRYNLLLHFITMWDFGLLVSEEIYQYMRYVDGLVGKDNLLIKNSK
jgi:hypothetical protein